MTEADLRLRAVVPAPLKVTYEALTDPAALRVWLAEHADVDLPGKYEFWGRFTPDGAEPHQRVLHVDERTIRFAWTVDGVETTTQFELAEDEDGTLVTLSQSDLPSFEDVLADTAGARGALQTFWTLAIANLADYLAGRELTPKCDFTSTELHASMVIDAAPEQGVRLDDPAGAVPPVVRRQRGHRALCGRPLRDGRLRTGPRGSQVRRVRAGPQGDAAVRRRLHLDSWELEGSDGKTRLTTVQSGFDPTNPPYPGWAGWLSGLAALRRYHELPQWRSIWRQIEVAGVPEGMVAIDQ